MKPPRSNETSYSQVAARVSGRRRTGQTPHFQRFAPGDRPTEDRTHRL